MLIFNVYSRTSKHVEKEITTTISKQDEKGNFIRKEDGDFIYEKVTHAETHIHYIDILLYCVKITEINPEYTDNIVVNIYEFEDNVNVVIKSNHNFGSETNDCISYVFNQILGINPHNSYDVNKYHFLANLKSWIGTKYKSVLNRFKHQEEWKFKDMIQFNKSQLNVLLDKRNELNRKYSNPKPENWLQFDAYVSLCLEFKKFYFSYHNLYINYEQTIKINRILNEMERSIK